MLRQIYNTVQSCIFYRSRSYSSSIVESISERAVVLIVYYSGAAVQACLCIDFSEIMRQAVSSALSHVDVQLESISGSIP